MVLKTIRRKQSFINIRIYIIKEGIYYEIWHNRNNWITDKLLSAGAEIEDFELAAVYSRKEETARKFAEKYGVKKIFTDLEEMAESDEIEGVYIASPNSLHAEQSMIFLSRGKAVLCEKPSASNKRELEKVIKTARENNALYMEAMKIPFIPYLRCTEGKFV